MKTHQISIADLKQVARRKPDGYIAAVLNACTGIEPGFIYLPDDQYQLLRTKYPPGDLQSDPNAALIDYAVTCSRCIHLGKTRPGDAKPQCIKNWKDFVANCQAGVCPDTMDRFRFPPAEIPVDYSPTPDAATAGKCGCAG